MNRKITVIALAAAAAVFAAGVEVGREEQRTRAEKAERMLEELQSAVLSDAP